MTTETPTQSDLRQLAITRLRKKREWQAHALAYLLVNLFLIAIWLLTSTGGFFWPMFPLVGWGIGLAFYTWDTFGPAEPTEESIEREMKRLAHP